MKIHLTPTGLFSPAMVRIANALTYYAPPSITLVKDRAKADIALLYVIAPDAMDWARNTSQPYVAVQCCFSPHHPHFDSIEWPNFWDRSLLTWSYYDLSPFITPSKFYLSPLGVDTPFISNAPTSHRDLLAITTGQLNGPGAEAISEVWEAINVLNGRGLHIGACNPVGMSRPPNWKAAVDISDEDLAYHYSRAKFVAALRHVEGFELPAAEGLCMGAHPVLFDLPCYRQHYDGLATFVPESDGPALTQHLVDVMSRPPRIGPNDRHNAIAKFDWEPIATGFWARLTHQYLTHTNTHEGVAVTT